MRVCIVTIVFPPEPPTSAQTSADIAEAMAQRGHDVTVLAPFPNRPSGNLYPGYRRRLKQVIDGDKYRIIYTWHTLSKKSTLLSRTAENISFGITSTFQLIRETKPDVVFLNTWPLFARWMNMFVLTRRQIPVVSAIKDLYPETFFSDNEIRNAQKPLFRLAKALDENTMRQSSVVAPLNQGMAEFIMSSRRISPKKVNVIPDWVDASSFTPTLPKKGRFRTKHGLSADMFLALYVGGMTRMADLNIYVKAAERLRHRQDICIFLVGDGSMRLEIESTIRQKNLQNIRLSYPLHPGDVPEVQAAADILMLSLLPGTAAHATPSKLIYYLFSQRPVLASVDPLSSAARIIEDAKCGDVFPQGDAAQLASRLEQMADNRNSLEAFGENARQYAERHFLRSHLLPRVCNLLERTANATCSNHVRQND